MNEYNESMASEYSYDYWLSRHDLHNGGMADCPECTTKQTLGPMELYNAAYNRVGNGAYNKADSNAAIDHNLPDNIRPVMGVMAQDVVVNSLEQLLEYGDFVQMLALLPAWQVWHDAMIKEAKVYLWIMEG